MNPARGYRFLEQDGEPCAVYSPVLHQVWMNLDGGGQRRKRVHFEEASHVVWTAGTPSQFYPLLNWLTGKRRYQDVNAFRDLVEGLFTAFRVLTRPGTLSNRYLPTAHPAYRAIGREVLDSAKRFARSANPGLTTPVAEEKALRALLHFLHQVIPARPESSLEIVRFIGQAPAPKGWSNTGNLISHLFGLRSHPTGGSNALFTTDCGEELHARLLAMIIVLQRVLAAPLYRIVNSLPAVLRFLTLGQGTFLPLLTFGRSEGLNLIGVQVWNETNRSLRGLRLAEHLPSQLTGSDHSCWAMRATNEWFHAIASAEPDWNSPYARCAMLAEIMRILPEFVRRWRQAVQGKLDCPECVQLLRCGLLKRRLAWCLDYLERGEQETMLVAANRYPDWLRAECIQIAVRQPEFIMNGRIHVVEIEPSYDLSMLIDWDSSSGRAPELG